MFQELRVPFVAVTDRELVHPDKETYPQTLSWWMEKHLPDTPWESAIRGYVSAGRVQFFTGKDYGSVGNLSDTIIQEAIKLHNQLFQHITPIIYDGVFKEDHNGQWCPIWVLDDEGIWVSTYPEFNN